MAVATQHTICKEIVDALGLKGVRKFVLTMEVNSAVMIDVERFAEADEVGKIKVILEQYEIGKRKGT